ncbi:MULTISPECIES: phosphatase PAP2 family protein [unclassified Streptomyces]|uniref:phosphatase PAP2 family protein n=1 Tax=unclassified Streptomyces TaxID=2593676 RepID=UPI002254DBF6|nr:MULTISPECIES: phosphatase PAP2 family protein [unclassified Streptomyces]MCX4992692.1 phosphatase PAP2 family protein [Streptomyces sp. NBC_00568]MCX5002071.1 phosphatase PAP2 family protein [Streptomyces sp. NBC_00638]
MNSPTPGARTAALSAAVLALVAVVLLLLVAFSWDPLISLDGDIARTTHIWAVDASGVTHGFRILTDWVWDPWTMRALCAGAVVWLVWRHSAWGLALWVVATCALGTLTQQGMKAAVGRERPVWPDPVDSAHYAAFPSGHALTATVACGLLLWLLRLYDAGRALRRTALALAVVSAVGVGLTRVWLGVHWVSDVVGGWLIGALIVALSTATYERWGERGRLDRHRPRREGLPS